MSQQIPAAPLSVEEIARFPRPGAAVPQQVAFSPDGQLVTYLFSPERGLAQQLYSVDVETGERRLLADAPGDATGEEGLSLEERLRRERLRQRAVGITAYSWARKGRRVLVPHRGAIYVMDGPGEAMREVLRAGEHPALDARFSPDGESVAFVRDAELYTVPAGGGQPTQVTSGARGTGRTHGLAEFMAQEEMGRMRGYWWSRDGRRIAFAEVDETHIPVYRIIHQGKDAVGEGAQEDHRYPFAGCDNARVRLGVVSRDGDAWGEPVWMELDLPENGYVARVDWFHDGSLAVQTLDRAQAELRLLRCDPATGAATELLRESSASWINLHDMFRPLRGGVAEVDGAFLWGSEATGFRHLELRGADGQLIRSLTGGPWVVDTVVGVDEERAIVYFTGNRDGPAKRDLYAVPLSGGEARRVTVGAGTHLCVLDSDCERFVDLYHAIDVPPTVVLRRVADSTRLHALHEADDPRIAEIGLVPPEMVTVESRDGVPLHGALYRPEGAGPWPVVVSVYGGPHAQRVRNAWDLTVDMRAQALRRLGFVVFVLDNRGSARRGLAFESVIRHHMGTIEIQDQVDGVRWLVDNGIGDPDRVGIYGWSYGGYMAAMCLAQAPDVFHAAVSGAPVTHWDGYDTCYTERYMGTPASNPEGYERGSVMHHVEGIRGRLLLVHGMLDENVHFRHTARLVNALIRARKRYELLLFPDERHMPRGEADRIYMEERIQEFLLDALGDRTP